MLIAVDPHKESHTAVALASSDDPPVDRLRVANTAKGLARLLAWAEQWPQRRWAIEGAHGLGHHLAQHLVARGERVVDVPAALAARARLLGGRSNRKTDLDDAVAVGQVALARRDLRAVRPEDHRALCRLLVDHRDDLVGERTRVNNRLHRLLRDLLAGGAPRKLDAAKARQAGAASRPPAPQTTNAAASPVNSPVTSTGSTGRSRTTTVASGTPSSPPAPVSARCTASPRSPPPRSWGAPAPSSGSPPGTTTPATPAPPPSRPAAATASVTASIAAATAGSTRPSTRSR